jgi:hypothetical protein
MTILPPTSAGPPPTSSPGAPSRPINSRWRLPSHRSTVTARLRPNQSLILHRPGHHSRRGNSTPPPSPLASNPHRAALPSRLPHPRDFVPWRLSDACRPRPPTPASPLRRPTNLHTTGPGRCHPNHSQVNPPSLAAAYLLSVCLIRAIASSTACSGVMPPSARLLILEILTVLLVFPPSASLMSGLRPSGAASKPWRIESSAERAPNRSFGFATGVWAEFGLVSVDHGRTRAA